TLQDGHTYYVINPNPANGTFQLAATSTSNTPITLNTSGLGANAKHTLTPIVDIGTATGDQTLRIDITGSTVPGPQHNLGSGGTWLSTLFPPPGDGVSMAHSHGSGGGFVGVSDNTSTVTENPNVKATVSAQALSADGSLTINTQSTTDTVATTDNGAAG